MSSLEPSPENWYCSMATGFTAPGGTRSAPVRPRLGAGQRVHAVQIGVPRRVFLDGRIRFAVARPGDIDQIAHELRRAPDGVHGEGWGVDALRGEWRDLENGAHGDEAANAVETMLASGARVRGAPNLPPTPPSAPLGRCSLAGLSSLA